MMRISKVSQELFKKEKFSDYFHRKYRRKISLVIVKLLMLSWRVSHSLSSKRFLSTWAPRSMRQRWSYSQLRLEKITCSRCCLLCVGDGNNAESQAVATCNVILLCNHWQFSPGRFHCFLMSATWNKFLHNRTGRWVWFLLKIALGVIKLSGFTSRWGKTRIPFVCCLLSHEINIIIESRKKKYTNF